MSGGGRARELTVPAAGCMDEAGAGVAEDVRLGGDYTCVARGRACSTRFVAAT